MWFLIKFRRNIYSQDKYLTGFCPPQNYLVAAVFAVVDTLDLCLHFFFLFPPPTFVKSDCSKTPPSAIAIQYCNLEEKGI